MTEATASLDDLYPRELGSLRLIEAVHTPGFPPDTPAGDRTAGSVREFYEPRMRGSETVRSGDRSHEFFFVDKLHPHSRYDMMILAGDEDIHSSIADLAPEARTAVMRFGLAFVDFVSTELVMRRYGLEGGAAHLCWNYDRATVDRENGMFFEKRFHLHMNYWPPQDIEGLAVSRWGDIADEGIRRRLVDPLLPLGERIAYDRFQPLPWSARICRPDASRDVAENLPPGLKIRLDSWDDLASESVVQMLVDIHTHSQQAYRELQEAFTGTADTPEPWTRPALRPRRDVSKSLAAIEWLSDGTREQLGLLAAVLRDVSADYLEELRADSARQIRHLTLAGLDYSVGFHSPRRNTTSSPLRSQAPVFLTVQYKLFADIGGAGIPPMPGASLARISRNGGSFTADEERERADFQSALLAHAVPAMRGGEHAG